MAGGLKVLIADPLAPAAAERLRAAAHEVVERGGLAGPALIGALAGVSALLVRGATKVTAEVIRGATDLRVVARAGSGLDNVDVAAAKERGLVVLNTPGANAISVAELAFGMMLALERHLVPAVTDLKAGRWEKSKYAGRELGGQTLGLLGFGRIGREVAVRARAFGMRVIATDPLLGTWPATFDWVRRTTLDAMLPEIDILSLHVPLTAESRNVIGAAQLARMKKSALLVNCARGGTVDEAALAESLTRGELRGAALDVFATEPAPADHPLLKLPNVIATPHLGAATREAQDRAGIEAADLVIEALSRIEVR